jgi:hypothetical protein
MYTFVKLVNHLVSRFRTVNRWSRRSGGHSVKLENILA